jgi:tetratricopeptide (TPR) repeat protein
VKFRKTLEIEPRNAFVLAGYAEVLFQQKKYEEAVEKFREAVAINPGNKFAVKGIEKTLDKISKNRIISSLNEISLE